MTNKICASIITYNIDKKIENVVESIIDQVEKVIIVDNGSSEETIRILNHINKISKVTVIFNDVNVGIAKALNQSIDYAIKNKMDWILTLDHDSICDKNMILNMMKIYNEYPKKEDVGVLTPQIFEVNKQQFISKESRDKEIYTEVKDCIQSGSLFKISALKQIGLFNEDLFIYHVDYDYCERIRNSNFKIIQCNNTILNHEEGCKTPKKIFGFTTYYNNYSLQATYYITRNTVYMATKYSIKYLKRIVKDLLYILLFEKKKKKYIQIWTRGLLDGLLNKYGEFKY